jgi:hypothetical protein
MFTFVLDQKSVFRMFVVPIAGIQFTAHVYNSHVKLGTEDNASQGF